MQYLDWDLGPLSAGTAVEFQLDQRAFVRLLDPSNLQAYRSGRRFQFVGGEAIQRPCRLVVPHAGHWHAVVDLGGAAGRVSASVRVLGLAAA